MPPSAELKRPLIEVGHPELSVRRQCELLGLNRSSLYYEPVGETPEDLRLMRLIDEQYTACPFYGSRKMTVWLTQQGEVVNRKRVQRLMRVMGLEAIYPKTRLSEPGDLRLMWRRIRPSPLNRREKMGGRHITNLATLGPLCGGQHNGPTTPKQLGMKHQTCPSGEGL